MSSYTTLDPAINGQVSSGDVDGCELSMVTSLLVFTCHLGVPCALAYPMKLSYQSELLYICLILTGSRFKPVVSYIHDFMVHTTPLLTILFLSFFTHVCPLQPSSPSYNTSNRNTKRQSGALFAPKQNITCGYL